MKTLFNIILLLLCTTAFSANKVLNVYNWTGYISPGLLNQFTKETGIHVNFAAFSSNDELYTKIKVSQNHSNFDLIGPSADYVDRMRKEHLLEKLDKSRLPNFKNLNPVLLNKAFDPNNDYSLPYLWGSTGIVLDTRYHDPKKVRSLKTLWMPRFHDQLLMPNDIREIFTVGLKVLGYDANDTDPKHIKQAYQKLRALWPNILVFNNDAAQSMYANGDATIGMSWSGAAVNAMKNNPHLTFIAPQEGLSIWIDTLAIPKNAPHLKNAYRFLNFIMRPDIAAQISANTGYPTPNLTAWKHLPATIRNNTALYPTKAQLKAADFQNSIGSALPLYQHYWMLLKLAS